MNDQPASLAPAISEATQEEAQPFFGIDPDDTAEVSLSGAAAVTVGPMPAGLWQRIRNEAELAFMDAQRRAIRDLTALGVDPEAPVFEDAAEKLVITQAALRSTQDPEYVEKLTALQERAAKYAVRGHKGIVRKGREPVPFVSAVETYQGQPIPVVAEATLRLYRYNRDLLNRIWLRVRSLHMLGPSEKKD